MLNPIEFTALDPKNIQASLSTKTFGRRLRILPEVSSTNTYAQGLAESGNAHGTVIVAEQQTAGRGRLNRTWFSPPGLNLYTSVILLPARSVRNMSWIPLIAGLALTETVHHVCGLKATLKWPNDILLNDKKFGGILCEGNSQGPSKQVVVVGIGLNVNMSETDFPEDLHDQSTSLRIHTGTAVNRNTLLAQLLNALEAWYTRLTLGHLGPVREAYTAQCGTLNRELLVHLTNGEEFTAVGHAIGEDGSLHVSLQNAPDTPIRIIQSGEVTHMKIKHS